MCLDIKNKNKNISVLNEFKMYVYNSVWPSQIKIQYLSFTTKIVFSRSNKRNQQKKKKNASASFWDLLKSQHAVDIDLMFIYMYVYTNQIDREGERRECFDSKSDF